MEMASWTLENSRSIRLRSLEVAVPCTGVFSSKPLPAKVVYQIFSNIHDDGGFLWRLTKSTFQSPRVSNFGS